MLDFGIHPGLSGTNALPFIDRVDIATIDILLISHFHLDHCGALPWFLEKTEFKGKCYMTHATKAIYKWLLSDFIKVSNIGADEMLYSEVDLENSMSKIETINFHQEIEFEGIKFWCYHAGHVLGAAMFMIEIAGVRILYTGDFSRVEDRHLMAAELPTIKPDVLIIESTYGVNLHEPREEREKRFTDTIRDIVLRGGKCLIPVFALGRAQELLLILDEYWSLHPELHEIPIYYASSLAKKCMAVYQTYVNAMNEKIRKQIGINNPFVFKHISNLKNMDEFDDMGPCVVMASPGMMQSGLSRELFESWCTDKKSGVIIAGYCVEGTLAKHLLNDSPTEITTMAGQRLKVNCAIEYISFSAHTDFKQTTQFIRALKPAHIILVHGEATEMGKLKDALIRQYEDITDYSIQIYNPKNTQPVELYFRGEKSAKVIGKLASTAQPVADAEVSGILVKRNFKYHIISPEDLPNYTDLAISTVLQRQSVPYKGDHDALVAAIQKNFGNFKRVSPTEVTNARIRILDAIDLIFDKTYVILEWSSSPINDFYADSILATIFKTEIESASQVTTKSETYIDLESTKFEQNLMSALNDMFESSSIEYNKEESIQINLDNNKCVAIDLKTLEAKCEEDEHLESIVVTVIKQLKSLS